MTVRVQTEDFDVGARDRRAARRRSAGRRGRGVHRHRARRQRRRRGRAMTLEHYPGMTEKALAAIVDEAKARWRHLRCARHPSRRRARAHRPDRAGRRDRARIAARPSPRASSSWTTSRRARRSGRRRRRRTARAGSRRARATTTRRRAGKPPTELGSVNARAVRPSSPIDWGTTSARAIGSMRERRVCIGDARGAARHPAASTGGFAGRARDAARRLARRSRAAPRLRHDRQPPGLDRGALRRVSGDARRRWRAASCARRTTRSPSCPALPAATPTVCPT